ncbi:MAG: outer membrane beta-barrel protein [Actinobacteria bacterium]|nr:outer membrane beta-barrel protein [Actinomycetota bacterium]
MLKHPTNFVAKIQVVSLLLIIVAFATPAHAQKSSINILAGPTAATLSGSYIQGSSGLEMGFSFWLTIERRFNSRWAFETGFGWVQKGGKKILLSGDDSQTYGFQTSYLQIPLLIRATFPIAGGPWYIAPYTGLAIGSNVGCKHKLSDELEFDEEPCDENSPGGKSKTLEFSIPIGAHFWHEFPGGSRFMLDLHYEYGLTNVFTAAADAGQVARNNVLVAMFGFSLPLQ